MLFSCIYNVLDLRYGTFYRILGCLFDLFTFESLNVVDFLRL